MITVYYDGKCGLCSKEINHYKKIVEGDKFNWVDITIDDKEFVSNGFKVSEGLNQLHIKDENGQFHIGVDAFITIWKNIKYWKTLAKIISFPLIKIFAELVYNIFANWRFKKLNHCQLKLDEENKI